MKLIAGLGNSGQKFKNNRHNLGYMIAETVASGRGLSWELNRDLLSLLAKNREVILQKPTTFMNESGQAVCAVARYFKIAVSDILVIHDDVDLDFGKMRLTFGGSAAGHHGVESVISGLSKGDFNRLRIGVGHPLRKATDGKQPSAQLSSTDRIGVNDYVLSDFDSEQKKELSAIITKAVEAVSSYLEAGIDAAMNRFN